MAFRLFLRQLAQGGETLLFTRCQRLVLAD